MDRVSDRDERKKDMGDGIYPGIGLGTLTWVKGAFFIHHSSQTNTPALCLLDHKARTQQRQEMVPLGKEEGGMGDIEELSGVNIYDTVMRGT